MNSKTSKSPSSCETSTAGPIRKGSSTTARQHGVDGLLANPLTLRLLVDAVRHSGEIGPTVA